MPFQASTWRFLDRYGEHLRAGYWKAVPPTWGGHTPGELDEMIDRLLEARRPRAAFAATHIYFKQIDPKKLMRLLHEVAAAHEEPEDHYRIESYYVSEALKVITTSGDINGNEIAQLEFFFAPILERSEHGIPNLERQIAESPMLFAEMVRLSFKRDDEGEDPPEWRIEDPGRRRAIASAAHHVLRQMKRLPGTDEAGNVDSNLLTAWSFEVRRLCYECSRGEIGDECLGQLLAKASGAEDEMWPRKTVCEVMERIAAPGIGAGFRVGVSNSRGAYWRGEGGAQERDLAAKYRARAEQLHFEYPYVGRVVQEISASYEREADRWDSEASIEKRLPP